MEIKLETTHDFSANQTVGRQSNEGVWSTWVVVAYAMAMAWVESAVVFYLRSMLGRMEPHQANPLPFVSGLAGAEIIREAATLVMLLAVGWLAGRTWRSRIGYGLLAFGVWDIAYYLWLKALTSWPNSLSDWDILFLIPLPWWGPVWAPMSIAFLMIVFGATVGQADRPAQPLWPSRASVVLAMLGGVLALAIFMADAFLSLAKGATFEQVGNVLPQSFHWTFFVVALVLMAVPVAQVVLRASGGRIRR